MIKRHSASISRAGSIGLAASLLGMAILAAACSDDASTTTADASPPGEPDAGHASDASSMMEEPDASDAGAEAGGDDAAGSSDTGTKDTGSKDTGGNDTGGN